MKKNMYLPVQYPGVKKKYQGLDVPYSSIFLKK